MKSLIPTEEQLRKERVRQQNSSNSRRQRGILRHLKGHKMAVCDQCEGEEICPWEQCLYNTKPRRKPKSPNTFTELPRELPTDEAQLLHHLLESLRLLQKVSLTTFDKTGFERSESEKIILLVADVMSATAKALKRGQH